LPVWMGLVRLVLRENIKPDHRQEQNKGAPD